MQTLYVVPEAVAMANSRDYPNRDKRIMDTLAFRKEKPEALEVMALDQLTAKTLSNPALTEWEKAIALSNNLQKFLALKAQAFPDQEPNAAFSKAPTPPTPPPIPSVPPVPANSTRLSNQLRHVKDFLTTHPVNVNYHLSKSAPVSPVINYPGPSIPPVDFEEGNPPHMEVEVNEAKDFRKRRLSVTPGNSPVSSTKGEPLLDVVSGSLLSGRDAAERRASAKRPFKPPRKRRHGMEITPIADVNSSFYKMQNRRTRGGRKDLNSPEVANLTEVSRRKAQILRRKSELIDEHIRRGQASTATVVEPDSWELDPDHIPVSARLQKGAGLPYRYRWIVI